MQKINLIERKQTLNINLKKSDDPGCYSNTENCVNCISNLDPVHTNFSEDVWLNLQCKLHPNSRFHFLNVGLISPDGRFTSPLVLFRILIQFPTLVFTMTSYKGRLYNLSDYWQKLV